jgi:light-regulated signal transduction histidine kinase (bacteriophytochrome)
MKTELTPMTDLLQAGRARLRQANINLGELVRETLGDFQRETGDRQIVWHVRRLPTIRADRSRLRTALAGLIANGVKFTGKGAVTRIEIGCASGGDDAEAGAERAHGAGLAPGPASQWFSVFQRLQRRQGGRIWAEGAVAGGATFYFSTPTFYFSIPQPTNRSRHER